MEYNVKNYSKKKSVLHEKTTELSEVSDNQIFQTIQLLKKPLFLNLSMLAQPLASTKPNPVGANANYTNLSNLMIRL